MNSSPLLESVDGFHQRHNGNKAWVQGAVRQARQSLFRLFCERMRPSPDSVILDLGVTNEITPVANMLEQLYPHRDKLVCAGLTDGAAILTAYPGVRHIQIQADRRLPFRDKEFTIGHSNAVLEHVGGFTQQKEFVRELCRVSQRAFLAVPNRWFPIEVHTVLPLIHYLPAAWFRRILRGTRFSEWSQEKNLNYVSAAFLRSAWPSEQKVRLEYYGLGVGMFKSNLVAHSV